MKTYYAIQWTYGRATNTKTGVPIGTYHSFCSQVDRQAWILDAQTPYTSQGGARETVTLRVFSAHVKNAQKYREIIGHVNYKEEKEALQNILLSETRLNS